MKTSAISVWIFINILCFGMCGYLYLVWSQYWLRMGKHKFYRPTISTSKSDFTDDNPMKIVVQKSYKTNFTSKYVFKYRRSAVGAFWSNSKMLDSSKRPSATQPGSSGGGGLVSQSGGSPRFPNVHKENLQFDTATFRCTDYTSKDCTDKTAQFKTQLLKEFHRVLMNEGYVFRSGLDIHNSYNVQHSVSTARGQLSAHDILCALKRVTIRTVTSEDEPFKSEGFAIPDKPLQKNRQFKTCAVITSAGALVGSKLGQFINSHDMVLRFNNAPTDGFENDVGSNTTFRILNSQVVSKPQFGFLTERMFAGSILVWDPANYSASLHDWFHNPDYPLFPVYKKLLQDRPDADVHLLRPEVLWELWLVLQQASEYRLRRNPPSSGFIGLWFSLHRCDRVRMFEYVPSVRATSRCHYHAPGNDTGCTLGTWHPLAQEKILAEKIRDNSDIDVFQKGFIDVPGFSTVQC